MYQKSPALIKLRFYVDIASIIDNETEFFQCLTELLSRSYISEEKAKTERDTKIIRNKITSVKNLYINLKTYILKLNEYKGDDQLPNTANDQCFIDISNNIIQVIIEHFSVCQIAKGHAPESQVPAIANALKHLIGNYMSIIYLGLKDAITQTLELIKYTELLTANKFPPQFLQNIEIINTQQNCQINPHKTEKVQVLNCNKGEHAITCNLVITQYEPIDRNMKRLIPITYPNFVAKHDKLVINMEFATVADTTQCTNLQGETNIAISETIICDGLSWHNDACITADIASKPENIVKNCEFFQPYEEKWPIKTTKGILFSGSNINIQSITWLGSTITKLPAIIEATGNNPITFRSSETNKGISDNSRANILHLTKYSAANLSNFAGNAIAKQYPDMLEGFFEELAIISGLSLQALMILTCILCICKITYTKYKRRKTEKKMAPSIKLITRRNAKRQK